MEGTLTNATFQEREDPIIEIVSSSSSSNNLAVGNQGREYRIIDKINGTSMVSPTFPSNTDYSSVKSAEVETTKAPPIQDIVTKLHIDVTSNNEAICPWGLHSKEVTLSRIDSSEIKTFAVNRIFNKLGKNKETTTQKRMYEFPEKFIRHAGSLQNYTQSSELSPSISRIKSIVHLKTILEESGCALTAEEAETDTDSTDVDYDSDECKNPQCPHHTKQLQNPTQHDKFLTRLGPKP